MPRESDLIAEMKSILMHKLEQDYQAGETKRDAHPKCLGLLKADFTVVDNIPEAYQVGVFKTTKTYQSWIRVSNSSGQIQSDEDKDFRGFAIKLMGVNGARFSDDEKHSQDFLLLSNPTLPLGTVKLFRDAVYYAVKWNPAVLIMKFLLTGKLRTLKALGKGKMNHTSPLDINYWSTTPYQLGKHQVKYKITPTSKRKSMLPEKLTHDYLTTNMQSHLNAEPASFDFFIQPFQNNKNTPIEDAAIEWKEAISQPIKLAEITIPQQQFTNNNRFNLAETFSYSPANCLQVHRPIGGINRARVEIYKSLSQFRHERDNKTLLEPDTADYPKTL